MPRADYKTCRNCGAHADDVGELSRSRLCATCSEALLRENVLAMKAGAGVNYRRWMVGTVAGALKQPQLVNALFNAGAFHE